MQENEYQTRVLETESKPETLAINAVSLDMVLAIGMATGEVMNRVKRAMFYGKPLEQAELEAALYDLSETAAAFQLVVGAGMMQDSEFGVSKMLASIKVEEIQLQAFSDNARLENVNKRLLHGAIGEMSETAEKLEALRDQLMGGKFDIVNYAEELGDSSWYNTIQIDELQHLARAEATALELPVLDCSFAAIRARNIAKLEKRNKGRAFNAEATINRDTEAERAILESAVAFAAEDALGAKADREQQEATAEDA